MKRNVVLFAIALAMSGNASAQSTEALKRDLDEALRVIRELQERVTTLEQQKPAEPAAPTTTMPAASPMAPVVAPQSAAEPGAPNAGNARLEISGKVQLDFIYDFKRIDPDWNATLRPSKIPVNCPGDPGCGDDGETIFSVRQTTLGFKGFIPTKLGELKTDVSFDLFATGGGNTSARLLNAWAELGPFGAGQVHTLFMNADTFPNTIDYWGPNGMVYVRNPQIRYTPIDAEGFKVAFSLEAPNSAIDTGKASDIDPSLDARGRTKYPDFVGKAAWEGDWGNFQVAGLLRSVGFESQTPVERDDEEFGWGVNVNGWVNVGEKNRIVGQVVYGRGIASYMNDGGVDLAPTASLNVKTVKSLGAFVYYDHYWNAEWSSSIGGSIHRQDNTSGQLATAFKEGTYASVNLLWTPAKNVLTGVELLWGRLEQNDGESANDTRIQFSSQYKY
ncbi:MAG TPA: DcaP family trimeric outer membrane transporter [Burkholderiales bacterium]